VSAIERGSRVIVTDADGVERTTRALSGVIYKGFSRSMVWVNRPSGDPFDPVPWLAEHVRLDEGPFGSKELRGVNDD